MNTQDSLIPLCKSRLIRHTMATRSSASTMQAVVFKEPFKVAVEQMPIPTVQDPEDVVIKVGYTALCGR